MSCQKIETLPTPDLQNELYRLLDKKQIEWFNGQICLNCTTDNSYDFSEGTGSLFYDWPNAKKIKDKEGNEKIDVSLRDNPLSESAFKYFCQAFSNTIFEDVYLELSKRYDLGRVRIMKSKPKTCLSWHHDTSKRLHYPIKTQEGCLMVIEDKAYKLDLYTWYETDTTKFHTAFNGSKEERIHLVACILGHKQ